MIRCVSAPDKWYTVHTVLLDQQSVTFITQLLNKDVSGIIADYCREVYIDVPAEPHVMPYLCVRTLVPFWIEEEDPDLP